MDLVCIYTYSSGDDADDDVSKHLDTLVEERGNSQDTENLCINLLEVSSNVQSWVKDELTNVLATLLQIPTPKHYHYQFSLFFDPRYVIELKDIKTIHQSENMDTKHLSSR